MLSRTLQPVLFLLTASALFGQGAVPSNLSAWQEIEVNNARLAVTGDDDGGTRLVDGTLRLGDRSEMTFKSNDGSALKVAYGAITRVEYERKALPQPKATKNPWTWRHKVGREEDHILRVHFVNGHGPETATLHLHKDNYDSLLRLLEAKTGRRTVRTLGSVTWQ